MGATSESIGALDRFYKEILQLSALPNPQPLCFLPKRDPTHYHPSCMSCIPAHIHCCLYLKQSTHNLQSINLRNDCTHFDLNVTYSSNGIGGGSSVHPMRLTIQPTKTQTKSFSPCFLCGKHSHTHTHMRTHTHTHTHTTHTHTL